MSGAERNGGQVDGVDLIAAERRRQMEQEGWTPEHDDKHRLGELTGAAYSYTWLARAQFRHGGNPYGADIAPNGWPWSPSWWKPSDDPIRNLVKAGALIAAEIDRLQRLAEDRGMERFERGDDADG